MDCQDSKKQRKEKRKEGCVTVEGIHVFCFDASYHYADAPLLLNVKFLCFCYNHAAYLERTGAKGVRN